MSNIVVLNSRHIVNNHVAGDIGKFVAKHSNFQEMSLLQNKYISILTEYQKSPTLSMLSSIRMDRLEVFNKWLPEAAANYQKVSPFLISNMLRGDIFAVNIFDNLQKYMGREDLVVSYEKIHGDLSLKETFSRYGGAEDGRAILSAEHWLESEIAADIFGNSNELATLCAINTMLHIHNEYITCGV
ncbi:hypothetical protein EDM53_05435 [Rickettsiales endosymbiont of Peranema trichophorum]|uniref:hypothetical protein n=1 Tax=Rickettsiales endosymbiont of Peranema trichophorum TaxID=2486577 RepID=UPI0010233D4B|nr:hypothetical protein [Rickettsiales endosymbiont of Peranema trichophorum]RZI45319.1 hypothetical protein EDM53_05435 [Rickettsiales endosymbiont of Peranema trichophorum]